MKFTGLLLSLALLTLVSCRNNLSPGEPDTGLTAKSGTIAKYHQLLQGSWSWTASDRYGLVFKNDKSVFLTGGEPNFRIIGRPEKDSAAFTISDENCNPKAAYYPVARQLIHGDMYFLSMMTPITRQRIKKRCFAIMELGPDKLKIMDTDNGTILDYKR